METFGEERLRVLESSPTRFLIAIAISAPLIFLGIQSVHIFSQYRESTWYGDMAQWFHRQADEARETADRYGRWASDAKSRSESTTWKAKAAEHLTLAGRYETQARLCAQKAEGWSRYWFSNRSSSEPGKAAPSAVNSSLTAIGLPHGH